MQVGKLARADHDGRGARLGLQLSAFLLAFDASANGYIIQYWQERLGLGARLSSWFLGAYILGELAGAPLGGYLAAGWGAARAFRRAALLFALGALLAGSNLDLPLALAGRILQGLAAGPLLPLAAVLICEQTPTERQGQQLSILSLVYGVAFLVGIASVPRLLHVGYSWVFGLELILAALCLAFAPANRPALPSSGFDAAGLICWVLALSLLAIAFNTLGESPWWSVLAFVAGVVALLAFHAVERRTEDAMLPLELWARPRALPLVAVAIGSGFGQALVVALPSLATFLLDRRGEQIVPLLYPLIAGGLGAGVLSMLLLDRIGARASAAFGAVCCVISSATLAFAPSSSLWFCVAALALGLGTSALSGGALRHAVTQSSEPRLLSRAQSALGLFTNVGVLIGGALFGAVTAEAHGGDARARHVATAFMVAMVLAFAPVVRLPGRTRAAPGWR